MKNIKIGDIVYRDHNGLTGKVIDLKVEGGKLKAQVWWLDDSKHWTPVAKLKKY